MLVVHLVIRICIVNPNFVLDWDLKSAYMDLTENFH